MRLTPKERHALLLAQALKLAATHGYDRITRKQIADYASVSEALVTHAFGTMPNLRRAMMRAAVQQGISAVVAQGLAARDRQAMRASEAVKQAARAQLGVA